MAIKFPKDANIVDNLRPNTITIKKVALIGKVRANKNQ